MKELTLKQTQQTIKEWIDAKGSNNKWSRYGEYCHLVEEIGELGEALQVEHGERSPGPGSKGLADHADLKEELGDVFFTTVALMNRYNIDIVDCLETTIERYDKKLERLLAE